MEKGRVVIFAAGTGSPYFSTDTAASLRAAEIDAEVILLAKTCDGVYSADPKVDPNAVKYDEISYLDILNKDLKVMDSTATSLCRDNNIPLIVFATQILARGIGKVYSNSIQTSFSILYLKEEFHWNYLIGFCFIILAVFFIFKNYYIFLLVCLHILGILKIMYISSCILINLDIKKYKKVHFFIFFSNF